MNTEAQLEMILSGGSNALSMPGTESRLNDSEALALTVLCRQMQAYYPHQEFLEDTIRGYRFDLERLAIAHTLRRVKQALLDLRIRPGQKWFPHPTEVAERLEEIVKAEREAERVKNPYVPCGACSSGFITVYRDGERWCVRCGCWQRWKNGETLTVADGKLIAAEGRR